MSAKNCVGNFENQKGVALIMAMMIVALVAVVAVEISWRFELSMSRNSNRWYGMQAAAYLQGAEQLAMVALQEDLKDANTKDVDHLGEQWAQQAMPFPTDHGWVKGQIEDAHGRFNINLMYIPAGTCRDGKPPPPPSSTNQGVCPGYQGDPCKDYSAAQHVFIRLLQTINLGTVDEALYIDTQTAMEITDSVIDWLDEDSLPTYPGGAESSHYEGLDVPITIANQEMVSVSELQVIKGMPPALYNQLVHYVIALPLKNVTQMNINTSNVNLLRSVRRTSECDNLLPHDDAIGQKIFSFVSSNEFDKWSGTDSMEDHPDVPSEWVDSQGKIEVETALFNHGVSNYFLLKSEVGIGEEFVRRGQSLIYRDDGSQSSQKGGQNKISVEVVRRSDANF